MKRATTITLLCLGAGAFFVANAYERRCVVVEKKPDTADWSTDNGVKPALTPAEAQAQARAQTETSCRSDSSYSHYYSNHSYGSHSSGYGFASSGVARGGFGSAGHGSSGS